MQIKYELDDHSVKRGLDAMAAKGRDLRPLMQDIGEEMRRTVEKNFAAGGRPTPWKPSARGRRDGGKPLTDSGRLRRSFTVAADGRSVRVGTNVAYAGIHQFGGKTKPHDIRPVKKEALYWPGAKHPVKVIHHPGSRIPARPFLVIPPAEQRRIEQIAADYLGVNK